MHQQVVNFQKHTLASLYELTAAAGLSSPQQSSLEHFQRRTPNGDAAVLETPFRLNDSALHNGEIPDIWKASCKPAGHI